MTQARFGIVVPTLNSGSTIRSALTSICTQEIDFPVTVRVQDGGSTDNTLALVNDVVRQFEVAKFVTVELESRKDVGVAQALNRGFENLDAEILGWLGSDDLLLPGALGSISSYIEETGADWVTGLATVHDQLGLPLSLRRKRGPNRYPTGFSRALLKNGFFANGLFGGIQQEGTFWTRSLWEMSGSYADESLSLAFDFELWSRMARYSELVQLAVPIAAFRIRSGQLSSNGRLYRGEVSAVRKSLSNLNDSTAKKMGIRDFQRPVAFRSLNTLSWTTKRYVLGGRPFSRLAENLARLVLP